MICIFSDPSESDTRDVVLECNQMVELRLISFNEFVRMFFKYLCVECFTVQIYLNLINILLIILAIFLIDCSDKIILWMKILIDI
jgi:hypothetical protein